MSIRVRNNNPFNIGVKLSDGREQNIPARSYIPMKEDDIAYISAQSALFSKGYLRIDNEQEEERVLEDIGVVKQENSNFMSDEEITKHLKGSIPHLKKWTGELTDMVLIDRVVRIAKELDLPMSKMSIIKEQLDSNEM